MPLFFPKKTGRTMTKAAHRRDFFSSGLLLPRAFFTAAAAWAGRARMAYRSRRELAAMDDRMLSDIGISRTQAQHEANRKFWSFGPPPPEA
jgi:uncharacterized protein YjiS (DUF1127 family)